MAFIRTRTINGKTYQTIEVRWREGKRMRSKSLSIKQAAALGLCTIADGMTGNLALAAALPFMITHELVWAGNRVKEVEAFMRADKPDFQPSRRGELEKEAKLRDIDRVYGIDRSSREAEHASMTRMPQGARFAVFMERHAVEAEYNKEVDRQRAAAPKGTKDAAREAQANATKAAWAELEGKVSSSSPSSSATAAGTGGPSGVGGEGKA